MIKLDLPPCPIELTPDIQHQLTDTYKSTEKAVWKKGYIENALLAMTNNKCAYSEQLLNQESAYMEIDHFKCKKIYPDDVVTWGNLLPSCKKCNSTKGEHDVIVIPIVNPLVEQPRDFLYVKCFRYYHRNTKGKATIDVLALNDNEHFANPRARIALQIADDIETRFDDLVLAHQMKNAMQVRKSIGKIKSLLTECTPRYPYSAIISTYILYEFDTYDQLETFLKNNNYWDQELENLKNDLLSIALKK